MAGGRNRPGIPDKSTSPAVAIAADPGSFIAVANSDTPVLSANPDRKFALFVNDSNTDIYLSLGGTAVAGSGPRLNSGGGSYQIDADNLYTGAVSGIHGGGGTKNLTVTEG